MYILSKNLTYAYMFTLNENLYSCVTHSTLKHQTCVNTCMCKYIIYIHVNYIHFVDQLFIDLIGFSADFFILKKRGESSLTEQ